MHRCIHPIVALLLLVPAVMPGQATRVAPDSGIPGTRGNGSARVTGTVRDASGKAVAHSRVTVIGLGREVRSSERGIYVLDSLPATMFTLEAVRIGSMPGRVVVELSPGKTTEADISLGKGFAVLETREVSAQWTSEIERRAHVSTSGYFISPAEIAARGRNTPLAALLHQVPSVKVACARPSQCQVTMRGMGVTPNLQPRSCVPSLYVDGFRDRLGDCASIYSGEILAIEIYRDLGRPFEFLDDNKCGAIAVWMKPLEPRKKKPSEPPVGPDFSRDFTDAAIMSTAAATSQTGAEDDAGTLKADGQGVHEGSTAR